MMANEAKNWIVDYNHNDGRRGTVKVTTEIGKSGAFDYGNGKSGALIIDGYPNGYDLRYCSDDDLHMTMLRDYFGNGLVRAVEVQ